MGLKEMGWKWDEFIWFRTGASGRLLWIWHWTFGVPWNNKLAFNLFAPLCNGWVWPSMSHWKTNLRQMRPLCTWEVRYGGALGREVCMHSTTSELHGPKSQASRSTHCVCPRVGVDMVPMLWYASSLSRTYFQKRLLRRPWRRWEDNFKTNLGEKDW
jgi:hypothetical protein